MTVLKVSIFKLTNVNTDACPRCLIYFRRIRLCTLSKVGCFSQPYTIIALPNLWRPVLLFRSAALVHQNNLGFSSLRIAWLAYRLVWSCLDPSIFKWRQFSTHAAFHSCSVRSTHWGCNLSWMQSGRTLPDGQPALASWSIKKTRRINKSSDRRSFDIATSPDFLSVIDPRDHLLLPTLVPIRVQREKPAKLIASLPERRCLPKGIAGWYADIAWLSDVVS